MQKPKPPQWADRLLEWFCAPHLLEEVQGDLHERFEKNLRLFGEQTARREYIKGVLGFIKPFALKRKKELSSVSTSLYIQIMISNYFKVAFRNLLRYKGYSFINIFGLATGMAVAILIGLWIYDELSYNRYHKNYDSIAQVMENQHLGNDISTFSTLPMPLASELRTTYGSSFKNVAATLTYEQIIAHDDKVFTKLGCFSEPALPEMLSLEMLSGTKTALTDPNSILLSESLAKTIFGVTDPINKPIKLNNAFQQRVAGVYKDMPKNSQFNDLAFIAPVSLVFNAGTGADNWLSSSFQIYVQLHPNPDLAAIDKKINNVLYEHSKDTSKPDLFLFPMDQWHLYGEFKNGINAGGRIEFVWLFSIIGIFVLLLACINFMNLSTARSEKRAKEVGVRKAVGSVRGQLIGQFLSESLLVVFIAFAITLLCVQLLLPLFNSLADKQMVMLWTNPIFWLIGMTFCLFTGLIAGSYPAFYLSSFQAVSILKGTFRVGRFAAVPRKVMVVVQFTVSVTLIIGTIMVFRQIQFAKNRPIGYSRNGLLYIQTTTADLHNHFDSFRSDLIASGAVVEIAESQSPLTNVWNVNGGFNWEGKDPAQSPDFVVVGISPSFGKTIDWQIKAGRDFSKEFGTDSLSLIVNEAAVKFMGLKKPVGTIVREGGDGGLQYKIIGVINDMVMESPYTPARQTFFYLSKYQGNFVTFKINPNISASEALGSIETIFKKYNPASPFNYKFADQEYARKFAAEERIGTLALYFAILTIFISCLGLFGLASFVAEQRTKEIGVRKVLGASVLNLWSLLSKDFVILVVIAFTIASPIAWYFLSNWLLNYQYHTELSWWIFAASGIGALLVTLLTVSFQSIKAALMNPVKSLRSE